MAILSKDQEKYKHYFEKFYTALKEGYYVRGRGKENQQKKPFTKENQATLIKFFSFQLSEGVSYAKLITTYRQALIDLMEFGENNPLEDLKYYDKHKLREFIAHKRTEVSASTVSDYIKSLKRFYLIIAGNIEESEYPDNVRTLKSTIKKSQETQNQRWLTYDELQKLIIVAEPKFKAIMSLAFEFCTRPGELLKIRVKDVKDEGSRMWVTIPGGKTGSRRAPIYYSSKYLRDWLTVHPQNVNSKLPGDSFLFVNVHHNLGEKMSSARLNQRLKRLAKEANLHNPEEVTGYAFRHGGISHREKLNQSEFISFYSGHVKNSKALNRYKHGTVESMLDTIDAYNGVGDSKTLEPPKPIICFRCNEENGHADITCKRCGQLLDPKAAVSKIEESFSNETLQPLLNKMIERKFEEMLKKKEAETNQ